MEYNIKITTIKEMRVHFDRNMGYKVTYNFSSG